MEPELFEALLAQIDLANAAALTEMQLQGLIAGNPDLLAAVYRKKTWLLARASTARFLRLWPNSPEKAEQFLNQEPPSAHSFIEQAKRERTKYRKENEPCTTDGKRKRQWVRPQRRGSAKKNTKPSSPK